MTEWTWEFEGYDPQKVRLREALCTLGNGRFATRGAAPEERADDVNYPGTYAAGCYNRLTSTVDGHEVENEDLVNLPNWLPLRFRPHTEKGPPEPWLTTGSGTLSDHRLVLDLRRGILTRRLRHRDRDGRVLRVEQQRLVHMGTPHLAALRTVFTAENWTGGLDVESGLDGAVTNANVPRYRGLDDRHLTDVRTGAVEPDTAWLHCRTRTSDIRVGLAARTTIGGADPSASRLLTDGESAARTVTVPLAPGSPVTVDKTVALHTSRDRAISDPLDAALVHAGAAPGFAALLDTHVTAWEHLWRRAEIDVPGEAGRFLRLHLFHVLQTLSPHVVDTDTGVPARGLHGEAYRGHVFWDELFVLPFLNLHLPEVSRALLLYRHRRLPAACRAARESGRSGALYPWQSGSDGREETPRLHLNPRSGHWLPDHSRLQRHVGSAIAYNVWQYGEATGDTAFLHTEGAEMLLQIARFWGSCAAYDDALGRYRIRGVIGPDEYHDAYPASSRPGIDDNAYTNVMAAWVLERALRLVRDLPARRRQELTEQLGIRLDEFERWDEISRALHVPFHDGVISQFDGYDRLAELDWDSYRERYGDIRRLDRILEAEGDSVNNYKASKQADVLMLGYLLRPAELAKTFARLGHRVDDETWRRTVDYYLERTSHGSTLSQVVHGRVLAQARRSGAWGHCREALETDVYDVRGGTTGEGIHLGAMAGTLDLVERGLTGMEPRESVLAFDPVPLPELPEFRFSLSYRGHWGVGVRLSHRRLRISVPDSDSKPVPVVLPGQSVTIAPGEARTLRLPRP